MNDISIVNENDFVISVEQWGEDSVAVENFLERIWARPLVSVDLDRFGAEFCTWVAEGMPL